MARRLVTLGGVALSATVTIGTWLYVAGFAPPFPLNAWAFNALLLVCLAYALLFGRASHP
ncbi:MAG: hypothetical protein ACO1SX_01860 [Actinomycetota bacterium]